MGPPHARRVPLRAYRPGAATYRSARELLLDEVGVEPGAELRELHSRILAEDPGLLDADRANRNSLGPRGPTGSSRSTSGPAHAADRPATAIATASPRSWRAPAGTIVGTAGCGKTRLSIEAARTAASENPNLVPSAILLGASIVPLAFVAS